MGLEAGANRLNPLTEAGKNTPDIPGAVDLLSKAVNEDSRLKSAMEELSRVLKANDDKNTTAGTAASAAAIEKFAVDFAQNTKINAREFADKLLSSTEVIRLQARRQLESLAGNAPTTTPYPEQKGDLVGKVIGNIDALVDKKSDSALIGTLEKNGVSKDNMRQMLYLLCTTLLEKLPFANLFAANFRWRIQMQEAIKNPGLSGNDVQAFTTVLNAMNTGTLKSIEATSQAQRVDKIRIKWTELYVAWSKNKGDAMNILTNPAPTILDAVKLVDAVPVTPVQVAAANTAPPAAANVQTAAPTNTPASNANTVAGAPAINPIVPPVIPANNVNTNTTTPPATPNQKTA